jgi:CRISPR/Cas system-associated exonuclease Cas4 (RecB family)
MQNVNKLIFLNTLACPSYGWLMRLRPEKVRRPPTLGEKFRIEQGREVGRRAREVYPDGILVAETDMTSAIKRTRSLMNDPSVSVIFEGAFLVDNLAAKADILVRKDDGWHIIEVKSSVNDKTEFIDDMAYTALVFNLSNYKISKIYLMLISRDFRLGMDNDRLFLKIDHTEEVIERMLLFKKCYSEIEKITRAKTKPAAELKFTCKKCPLFKDCVGKDIKNHIFDLPRLSQLKFKDLLSLGIVEIGNIPDNFTLTDSQLMVKNCVKSDILFVGDGLKKELNEIVYPAYYLDFETTQTAIPLYPDMPPYTPIVTQYSIHKCSAPGNVIDHFEFLSDETKDDRRELAKHLMEDLEEEGSIITYSSYEKITINNLATQFLDISEGLNPLINRIVDIEAIIKKNFYHPDFHGSTSIKRTLPALVPKMSYEGLEIRNGDEAMATFACLARGKYGDSEVDTIKNHLLEYCKQDTLAMVELHRQLVEYI